MEVLLFQMGLTMKPQSVTHYSHVENGKLRLDFFAEETWKS